MSIYGKFGSKEDKELIAPSYYIVACQAHPALAPGGTPNSEPFV